MAADSDRTELDERVCELERDLKEVQAANRVNPTFASVTRDAAQRDTLGDTTYVTIATQSEE